MKQQILKPENWQDFEELCKVLWAEIWQCPEIKKNGRAGQNQQGVDIYGIPNGEVKYFGIQCKGKDEYTKAILTEKEIVTEIEKAKQFKPGLKKLYFATTANKDERLEEFVRVKNIENIQADLFEVHVFSWEDIAYLIEQNKRANEWYVKKMNFATKFNVVVCLDNGDNIKEFSPILLKNHIKYKYEQEISGYSNRRYEEAAEKQRERRIEIDTEAQPVRHFINGSSFNKSSCVFSIKILNTGNHQLENFKLYVTLRQECFTAEKVLKGAMFFDHNRYDYNLYWVNDCDDLMFKTTDEIIVPNDKVMSDEICIRPSIEFPFCTIIPWKLVSKDFTECGVFRIVMNTKIKEKITHVSYAAFFEDETLLQNYTGIEKD